MAGLVGTKLDLATATPEQLRPFVQRRASPEAAVQKAAQEILADVRARGDVALREWTRKLDRCDLEDPFLSAAEWTRLAAAVPIGVRKAIVANLRRIERFHRAQVGRPVSIRTAPGVTLGRTPVPHARVACYVPGGRAAYPSTVLMTVVPARLAGVRDIVVVTPPRPDGTVDPAVAFAARAAGATRILRAGGAQAVAAAAYGTALVGRAEAVVGPGNAYVTAAKQGVAADVWTDAPAGPSELLVVADGTADPADVALDLMAQAEHDPEAQVLLVTTSKGVAAAVEAELARRVPAAARRAIIEASLRSRGAILVARTLAAALAFADAYAPEHLTLMVRAPRKALARVRNAGSVFLGPHAPVSLGDYGSGTNHVLPTMGLARIRGGLGVEDFRKWVTWQEATAAGLRAIGPDVATVARAEGLVAHAEAVESRLQRRGPRADARPVRAKR